MPAGWSTIKRQGSCALLLPRPEISREIDQQNRNVLVRQWSPFEDHLLEQLLPAFRRRAAGSHPLQIVANRAGIEEDGFALAVGQRTVLLNELFDENIFVFRELELRALLDHRVDGFCPAFLILRSRLNRPHCVTTADAAAQIHDTLGALEALERNLLRRLVALRRGAGRLLRADDRGHDGHPGGDQSQDPSG